MQTKIHFCFWLVRDTVGLLGTVLYVVLAGAAYATHIPKHTDVNIVRPPMPMEGYLHFDHSLATGLPGGGGEERTGWTDIRHPAQSTLDGKAEGLDTRKGYDRSDHFVNARTTILTDASVPAKVAPSGGIPNDFDFANKAWAQAGLSFIEIATRPVKSPLPAVPPAVDDSFKFNLSFDDERKIMSKNNAAGTPHVEVYYTGGLNSVALAETYHPSISPGEKNEGIFMANTGVAKSPRNNTLAHELGHFLLDDGNTGTRKSNAVFSPNAAPNQGHSSDPRNIVGDPQWDPGSKAGESDHPPFSLVPPVSPPWDIANSIDVIGMTMSTDAKGAPKVGGTNKIELQQIRTVFSEPDVAGWLRIPNDRGLTFGDRADFDWVEDNIKLELAGGKADNHPGIDSMIWEIGSIAPSGHPNDGHKHDGWGELGLSAFMGDFFRTIDIVSQIGRYIDSDIASGGDLSRRESALDFRGLNNVFVEFSVNGITWVPGSLINVFIPGWNKLSMAEDYVSRWRSPIDATLVRLVASEFGAEHDGNAQIDAIIASRELLTSIPEPSVLALLGIAAGLLFGSRRFLRHPRLPGDLRFAVFTRKR